VLVVVPLTNPCHLAMALCCHSETHGPGCGMGQATARSFINFNPRDHSANEWSGIHQCPDDGPLNWKVEVTISSGVAVVCWEFGTL
jgi:hypothetical protein